MKNNSVSGWSKWLIDQVAKLCFLYLILYHNYVHNKQWNIYMYNIARISTLSYIWMHSYTYLLSDFLKINYVIRQKYI